MSVLILQIDIGHGTQWGKEYAIDPIRKIFIPSVKKYAKKHSYDYQLVVESEYKKKGGDFLFLATPEKHFSFERYFHFNQKYKSIVYIDNDVYISNNAEPLPEINGLMNAPEPEGNASKIFRECYNQPVNKNYYNSGVTFVDNKTAKNLQNYMLYRMKNKIRAKGKNSDNMMLNEYILENPSIFYELSNKWNYMPFLENSTRIKKANFLHFVGIPGKNFLFQILKSNKNLTILIEQLIESQIDFKFRY